MLSPQEQSFQPFIDALTVCAKFGVFDRQRPGDGFREENLFLLEDGSEVEEAIGEQTIIPPIPFMAASNLEALDEELELYLPSPVTFEDLLPLGACLHPLLVDLDPSTRPI